MVTSREIASRGLKMAIYLVVFVLFCLFVCLFACLFVFDKKAKWRMLECWTDSI